jgi:hypothetical protein
MVTMNNKLFKTVLTLVSLTLTVGIVYEVYESTAIWNFDRGLYSTIGIALIILSIALLFLSALPNVRNARLIVFAVSASTGFAGAACLLVSFAPVHHIAVIVFIVASICFSQLAAIWALKSKKRISA